MDKIGVVTTNYMVPNKTAVNKTATETPAVPQDKVSSGSSRAEAVDGGKLAKLKQAAKNVGSKIGKTVSGAGSAIKSGLLVASSVALTVGCIGLYAGHGILKLADKVNTFGAEAGGDKLGNALSKVTGDNAMTKVVGNAAAAGGVAALIGIGVTLAVGGPVGAAALMAGTATFGAGLLGGAYSAAEKK